MPAEPLFLFLVSYRKIFICIWFMKISNTVKIKVEVAWVKLKSPEQLVIILWLTTYCEWLKFCGAPIFVEGPIHEFHVKYNYIHVAEISKEHITWKICDRHMLVELRTDTTRRRTKWAQRHIFYKSQIIWKFKYCSTWCPVKVLELLNLN